MPVVTILADGPAIGVRLCRLALISDWNLADMRVPHWRLYAPVEAGGEIHWAGERHALDPSRWLLIAPGTACCSRLLQPFRKAYLHFHWPLQGCRPRPGLHAGPIPSAERAVLRRLAEGAADAAAQRELALRLQAIAARALLALPADALEAIPRLPPELAQVLALLCADPSSTPGNAELAAAVGLHPGSLVRLFSRELGESPQRYALRWRLEHAATLLLETDEPIEAIAERCGFGDRHHFSRAFARHWRCPPARYRARGR